MGRKALQTVYKAWKILRGDKVVVVAGKDRGLTGTVQEVLRDKNRVVVTGRNLVKKHVKKTEQSPGGIVTLESPLHVSNVAHADPVTGSPVRVVWRYLEDGTKVRVTKGALASGSIILRPEILKERRSPRAATGGPKDTGNEEALERTYDPATGEGGLPPLILNERGFWQLDFKRLQLADPKRPRLRNYVPMKLSHRRMQVERNPKRHTLPNAPPPPPE